MDSEKNLVSFAASLTSIRTLALAAPCHNREAGVTIESVLIDIQ